MYVGRFPFVVGAAIYISGSDNKQKPYRGSNRTDIVKKQDEEKYYNQLTHQVCRMTSQQRILYDKLNAICNDEFTTYMPRLTRE